MSLTRLSELTLNTLVIITNFYDPLLLEMFLKTLPSPLPAPSVFGQAPMERQLKKPQRTVIKNTGKKQLLVSKL
jgi:hypothetical protein